LPEAAYSWDQDIICQVVNNNKDKKTRTTQTSNPRAGRMDLKSGLLLLLLFLFESELTTGSWDQWWTYDGISGKNCLFTSSSFIQFWISLLHLLGTPFTIFLFVCQGNYFKSRLLLDSWHVFRLCLTLVSERLSVWQCCHHYR
jgi:hypothetical protein